MKYLIYILTLFVSTTLTVSTYASENETVAPDFTLNKLSGGTFTLSDYEGKVILIFFMGYGCPYCIDAAPNIKTDLITPNASNENFISVAIDTWQGNSTQVNNFKLTTGLDNITYCLNGHTMVNLYNLNNSYDRLVVVDKKGNITHKGTFGASSDISNAKSAIKTALEMEDAPPVDDDTPMMDDTTMTPDTSMPEDTMAIDTADITGINNNKLISIKQNYPNPFSENTIIPYSIENTSKVTLSILDITGKTISILVDEIKSKGEYTAIFNRQSLPSGIYFYRLQANQGLHIGKMTIK